MRRLAVPTQMLPHARRAAGTVLLVAAVAAAGWFGGSVWSRIRTHPYFRASQLHIRGVGPLLSQSAIRTWLDIDDRTTVWELEPLGVRARLEAHPLIAKAVVRREFPDRFSITIRERHPEAIAMLDRCYYLDRRGNLLGALGPEHSRDYPVITGPALETPPGLRSWLYKRALRVVRLCGRGGCSGELSEINVDRERGVVLYPMRMRASVILGWGSWREKLERFDRVLRAQRGATDDIRVVDLRYRNQVVVQREPRAPQKPVASSQRGVRI
jgi:cell division septal protein FtsQ